MKCTPSPPRSNQCDRARRGGHDAAGQVVEVNLPLNQREILQLIVIAAGNRWKKRDFIRLVNLMPREYIFLIHRRECAG